MKTGFQIGERDPDQCCQQGVCSVDSRVTYSAWPARPLAGLSHTELGIRHSIMQLRAMKRRWRATEESLGKILVGTLLIFKLDIMDRNSGYKVVKQVFRAPFCPK